MFNDDYISPGHIESDPASHEDLRLRQALALKSQWQANGAKRLRERLRNDEDLNCRFQKTVTGLQIPKCNIHSVVTLGGVEGSIFGSIERPDPHILILLIIPSLYGRGGNSVEGLWDAGPGYSISQEKCRTWSAAHYRPMVTTSSRRFS